MHSGDNKKITTANVGAKAPDFVLQREKGEMWRLSAQLGQVTALLFYPKNETIVCTKQMCSVRDNWERYLATKAVIVGISPGTVEEHQRFAENHQLPIPLLADPNGDVTRIFSRYWRIPILFTRAIVVIDAKGFIRSRQVMLRAFRPSDRDVITAIYAARSDALAEKYQSIKKSYWRQRKD